MNCRKEKGMTKREQRELKEQEAFDYLSKSSEEFRTEDTKNSSGSENIKNLVFSFVKAVLWTAQLIYGLLCIFGFPHMLFDSFIAFFKNKFSLSDSFEWSGFMILYAKRVIIFSATFAALKFPSMYKRVKNYLKRKSKLEVIKDILCTLDTVQTIYLLSITSFFLLILVVLGLFYLACIGICGSAPAISINFFNTVKVLFYCMLPIFVMESAIQIIQFFFKEARMESRCLRNMINEKNCHENR